MESSCLTEAMVRLARKGDLGHAKAVYMFFQHCVERGETTPPEILEFVSKAVIAAAYDPKRAGQHLGLLKKKRGPYRPYFKRAEPDYSLAWLVAAERNAGNNLEVAVENIAEATGWSETTVKNASRRFGTGALQTGDPFESASLDNERDVERSMKRARKNPAGKN